MSCQPVPDSRSLIRCGSTNNSFATGPGSWVWAAKARSGTANTSFSVSSCQHRKARRPPGRTTAATLVKATAGLSKNIMPKLLITASHQSVRSGRAWASPRTNRGVRSSGLRREFPGHLQHPADRSRPTAIPALLPVRRRSLGRALRGPGRFDRGGAAPAADVEHPLARRDARGTEQMRDEVLVFGQVPLAVFDPVLAARAVPALRLLRVGRSRVSHRWSPSFVPAQLMLSRRPGRPSGASR